MEKSKDMTSPPNNVDSSAPSLPGNGKRGASFGKWVPKRWEPIYEQIVVLSQAGYANTALAERFGYTPVHISNILNTPQARVLKAALMEQMHERALELIPDKLNAAAARAADRIRSVISNDTLFERAPFGVADRAFKLLEALNHVAKPNGGQSGAVNVHTGGGNVFVLPAESAATLAEGIKKSQEARALHGISAEVIDVIPGSR